MEVRLVLTRIGCLFADPESVALAFIHVSPFRSSPLATLPADLSSISAERLQRLLLAYLRLLTADPALSQRNDWPVAPLHVIRTEHPDLAARLLAVQVLAKHRGWSEEKRTTMEREWVGDVSKVDVPIDFGMEVHLLQADGFELRRKAVDGWMLPVLESRRIADRECICLELL
jgi:midasin